MRTQWDIVIIGAGPAGMSAALQATRHGLSVLVLDRQAEPGGQIFRSAGSASADKRKQIGADYARGEALVREFRQSPATFLGGANVWHLAPGRAYVSHQGTSHVMQARQILIATGAMERPVPLPGWTLPGVLGAGAADVLLKSASMLPEGPVVLCGNGPLILQTVVHLKHFGIPIAGVALTLETRDRLAKATLFRLYRCDAMQPFMETFFAPSPSALLPADDAVVCRCEELTAGELRRTIEAGCYSPDGLKSQARPGMGTCQGRMCSAAVAEMIAHAHGLPIETLPPYHAQPPLFPLPLEELASMSIPPEGL